MPGKSPRWPSRSSCPGSRKGKRDKNVRVGTMTDLSLSGTPPTAALIKESPLSVPVLSNVQRMPTPLPSPVQAMPEAYMRPPKT